MQRSDLGCPAVPAPATSHPLLLDLFPQAGVLPNTCPNCGNTNLTKFTSVFMKSPRCFKFSYFMHHFQKTFLFNLLLEEETIPPNQGFTNFTRPHPCQEILLSSSFPHLRIFYHRHPFHAPGQLHSTDSFLHLYQFCTQDQKYSILAGENEVIFFLR